MEGPVSWFKYVNGLTSREEANPSSDDGQTDDGQSETDGPSSQEEVFGSAAKMCASCSEYLL